MKLKATQVEAKATEAWGKQAFVIPYRIAGNRHVHAVTDRQDHWIALQSSWIGVQQLFEPLHGPWPEPIPMTWEEAVLIASQRALAHFVEQGNRAAFKRLPRASKRRRSSRSATSPPSSPQWFHLPPHIRSILPIRRRKGFAPFAPFRVFRGPNPHLVKS
jgi:hypothetical protein